MDERYMENIEWLFREKQMKVTLRYLCITVDVDVGERGLSYIVGVNVHYYDLFEEQYEHFSRKREIRGPYR